MYYLKKRITLCSQGVFIQPNPTYVTKMVSLLGVENKKVKSLPHYASLETYSKDEIAEHEKLSVADQKTYRSGLGLALYVAMDRPDIQQALRTLATYMSCGTRSSMVALRHLACYLKGTPELGVLLPWPEEFQLTPDRWEMDDWNESRGDRSMYNVETFADADWGGCKSTRKSTSSYMVFINGCLITSVCKIQATVALSSAESELYAACSGIAEMLQIGEILRFLVNDASGNLVRLKLYSDSSAARAIMQRLGQGKMKRLQIRFLWVQALLKQQVFQLIRVPTKCNVADLNTKRLSKDRRDFLMSQVPMASSAEDAEVRQRGLGEETLKKKVLRILMKVITGGSLSSLQGCSSYSPARAGFFMDYGLQFVIVIQMAIICYLVYVVIQMQKTIRAIRDRLWEMMLQADAGGRSSSAGNDGNDGGNGGALHGVWAPDVFHVPTPMNPHAPSLPPLIRRRNVDTPRSSNGEPDGGGEPGEEGGARPEGPDEARRMQMEEMARALGEFLGLHGNGEVSGEGSGGGSGEVNSHIPPQAEVPEQPDQEPEGEEDPSSSEESENEFEVMALRAPRDPAQFEEFKLNMLVTMEGPQHALTKVSGELALKIRSAEADDQMPANEIEQLKAAHFGLMEQLRRCESREGYIKSWVWCEINLSRSEHYKCVKSSVQS